MNTERELEKPKMGMKRRIPTFYQEDKLYP
jgi:hypothetical protein